jgi:hypothetical protein
MADHGYANFILERNGVKCGSYNSQYSWIFLDGQEYKSVDDAIVAHLLEAVRAGNYAPAETPETSTGITHDEAAAIDAMAGETVIDKSGYCPKCQSYCDGDCRY